jgi:hypothetical protein
MNDPNDDISMKLHGFGGRILASKHIAKTMAEMLIAQEYGDTELEAQRPLKVSELDDRWLIEGRDEYRKMEPPFEQSLVGPVTVEILKRNCRVIKFIQSSGIA